MAACLESLDEQESWICAGSQASSEAAGPAVRRESDGQGQVAGHALVVSEHFPSRERPPTASHPRYQQHALHVIVQGPGYFRCSSKALSHIQIVLQGYDGQPCCAAPVSLEPTEAEHVGTTTTMKRLRLFLFCDIIIPDVSMTSKPYFASGVQL
jgi:hypothetical protein